MSSEVVVIQPESCGCSQARIWYPSRGPWQLQKHAGQDEFVVHHHNSKRTGHALDVKEADLKEKCLHGACAQCMIKWPNQQAATSRPLWTNKRLCCGTIQHHKGTTRRSGATRWVQASHSCGKGRDNRVKQTGIPAIKSPKKTCTATSLPIDDTVLHSLLVLLLVTSTHHDC